MKNFGNKIDNDETSAGVVVANEYNSIFSEAKGAVTPFLDLNELDNQQLGKSIDIASKAMFYNDIGSPNAVHLTRGATTEQIETLFDGMVVFFSPANANTGASTLKVNGLGTVPLKYKNTSLDAGILNVGIIYFAVYDLSGNKFDLYSVQESNEASRGSLKVYQKNDESFGETVRLLLGNASMMQGDVFNLNSLFYRASTSTIEGANITGSAGSVGGVDASLLSKVGSVMLADYPTRKYNGVITLSESVMNFEYLMVISTFHSDYAENYILIPTDRLVVNNKYRFCPLENAYAIWVYTNTTTFTFDHENDSWIRAIYGYGRK